jgi:hypothetical protein
MVIGEAEQWREEIEQGEKEAAGDDEGEEDFLLGVNAADGFLIVFGATGEVAADDDLGDPTNEEDDVLRVTEHREHRNVIRRLRTQKNGTMM